MYVAIYTSKLEMCYPFEVCFLSVFYNENSVFCKNTGVKYRPDEFFVGRVCIRRICKNEVVYGLCIPDKFQNVGFYRRDFPCTLKLPGHHLNMTQTDGVKINRCHMSAFSGEKFEGNVSGTGTQIQNLHVGSQVAMLQNIEQAFLGKIGGGPGRKSFRYRVIPGFVFPADYTHSSWDWATNSFGC